MNPALSLVFDGAAAWFSRDEAPPTPGAHDPVKTGFNWQQLELAASSAVDPYFRFDAFMVFGPFGVEVEEAYATTLALPGNLQLRTGQFLTRFGRLNATHPHAWDFVDQPFALGRVMGGEGNRGLGAELSWLTPLPWYTELLTSVTEAAGEGTARSFYGGEDLGVSSPADLQVTMALKQFFTLGDEWGLSWGLSAATGPNSTGHGNRTEIAGTDVYLKYSPVEGEGFPSFTLQSEWFYRRRQVPRDVLSDLNGYTQVGLRFARRWSSGVRHEVGSPSWARGTSEDPLDPEWTRYRHRYTTRLTFAASEFSRFRLQAALDDPRWRAKPTWSVLLSAEFVIGAHGAHAY